MTLLQIFRRAVTQPQGRPKAAGRAVAAAAGCVVENLESRQLMSAALKVENLDVIPGYERMIFNRIQYPNTQFPNYVKDRGTLRLSNVGNQTLTLSGATISGPFKLLNALPSTLPVGRSVTVGVQFTATRPPAYTYNQTNYFNKASSAGTHFGTLSFRTNDPANPTYKEALAGWFQTKSEDNQEPGLQTIINLISDYKTNLGPRTVTFPQGSTATYYGEEVRNGGYWKAADGSRPIGVRHIASFHSQGYKVPLSWFKQSDKVNRLALVTAGRAGQTFLPHKEGQPGVPATASISPGAGVPIGFNIEGEYSDDNLNRNRTGGGHHVRFWPARDHFGRLLPNTYFMTMDYSVSAGAQNWDFQDNVYIIFNAVPASGGVVSPPPVSPPPPPPPSTGTASYRAVADAHVLNGPLANTNYGQGPEMRVRLSSIAGQWREGFMRFDLTQVKSASQITSAKVRLFGRLSEAGPGVNVGMFALTGGGWTENGVVWNNKPASSSTPLGPTRTIGSTAWGWYEFDVTGYLKQRKAAGATSVDLAVKATNYTPTHFAFASDEAIASNRPALVVS